MPEDDAPVGEASEAGEAISIQVLDAEDVFVERTMSLFLPKGSEC